MYYLTMTAKRKNAKRHIVSRSEDIEKLRKLGKNMNACYTVEIYNGKWEIAERLQGSEA